MPLCNGIELTPILLEAVTETVNAADNETIAAYITKKPGLAAGFRPNAPCNSSIKKRIIAQLKSASEYDANTIEFLYHAGLGQSFVVVLSTSALEQLHNQFHAWFGVPFILALVLDSRPDVQELARKLLDTDGQPLPRIDAGKQIGKELATFSRVFLPLCNPAEQPEAPQNHNAVAQLHDIQRQLVREEKRNQEISDLLHAEREKHRIYKEQVTIRIHELRNQMESCKQELVHARSKNEGLEAELTSELENKKAAIANGIKSGLKQITNTWLYKRVHSEESLAELSEAPDLLAEADHILACQSQTDRHVGNRKMLRERLEAVTARLHEIRDARLNAIHPVDGLKQIEDKLLEEEKRISAILYPDTEACFSPVTIALAARINASKGEEVSRLEKLYEELGNMGLANADLTYLQNCFSDRFDRLLAENSERTDTILPRNPALRFKRNLSLGQRVAIYCDGHNLINSMEVFRNDNHLDAREHLTQAVAKLSNEHQNCTACIVFDGPTHQREYVTENCVVIYSGGGTNEKHRADKRISEMLNWHEHLGEELQVYVVTADNEVANDACDKGAEVISLDQFGCLLR